MIEFFAIVGIVTIGAGFVKESKSCIGKAIALIITLCLFILMLL